jgi:alkaline phosphatase
LRDALRQQPNTNVAKNVILFLGDGMGVTTVTSGRIYVAQQAGSTAGEETSLAFETFPHVALSKTYNVDSQVPDSAGTATAFLTGVKCNIGVIGVNQDVDRAQCDTVTPARQVSSILRWSRAEGKRTGVVTTTRITHATPAAAYAHSADRDWEADRDVPTADRGKPYCRDMATQLVTDNSDINVILGGGRQKFIPNTEQDPEYPNTFGHRLDGRNLITLWENTMAANSRAYAYVWNKTHFDQTNTDYMLGLFEPSHMQYSLQRDDAMEPTLAEMTAKAIMILRRGTNGFFLLVEGGRIDHGHHDNSAKLALNDLKEFNDAIARAKALTSEEDTLIVVTADHSHAYTQAGYPTRGNPILAFVDDDSEDGAEDNMPYTSLGYANGPSGRAGRRNETGWDPTSNTYLQQSLVPIGSETHGGEDVAIYANGPMAHLFHGVQEQNYIAHAMAYASCVGQNKDHCAIPRAKP